MNNTKSAFVAIVGRPNVDKSSILNALLGQKVAIVSPKPQTTRTRIMGVLTEGNTQLVFTDTPGMHNPKTKLGNFMVNEINSSIGGVDFCALVMEEKGKITDSERELIAQLKKQDIPAVLVINKIDRLAEKELLAARIAELYAMYDFSAVVPVSALNGDGLQALKKEMCALAEAGPHFFPDDTLTDQPERVIAAEIIRESMLKLLSDEVPHGIAVDIESMKERQTGDILDLSATIYCEKDSHKGIIIGKKGAMLKKIGSSARYELERVFGTHINLELWVKVREDWRNREGSLRHFGFVSHDE
ncbi:MAG: GTPase Era [Clostridia bacterium]|nr:GTPase Era [Clostridia bacterium]